MSEEPPAYGNAKSAEASAPLVDSEYMPAQEEPESEPPRPQPPAYTAQHTRQTPVTFQQQEYRQSSQQQGVSSQHGYSQAPQHQGNLSQQHGYSQASSPQQHEVLPTTQIPGPYQQVYPQSPTTVIITTTAHPDYLGFSIFSMLCCCFCIGIAAVVQSCAARDANDRGDYDSGRSHGRQALLLNKIGLGIGLCLFVVAIVLIVLAVTGIFISNAEKHHIFPFLTTTPWIIG